MMNRVVVFLAVFAGTTRAQPQTATVDTVDAAVNSAISNPNDRATALCDLHAALWGGYRVRTFVPRTSATGSQPLIIQIAGGILTVQVNPSPTTDPSAFSLKDGIVFLPDRDVAFGKGIPFWIGDVTPVDAGRFRYTLYSNPSVPAAAAYGIFESRYTGGGSVGFPNNFTSSPQPQTFVGGVSVLDPVRETYLYAGGRSGCPISNTVDLWAASVNAPTLRRHLPVLQAFDNGEKISSGGWIQIFGEKLSNTTRSWRSDDFQGAQAPTSLDGVSVNMNGRPAFVSYISPNQINAQVPDDITLGSVAVEVANAKGKGTQMVAYGGTGGAQKFAASPALLTTPAFLANGKQYLAAVFPDLTTFVGPENLIPGARSRPARPGETIVVYAVGCGATSPPTSAGQVLAESRPLALPYTITIGQAAAQAQGFLAGGAIGLCQFNITVPDVADGDVPVSASVAGVAAAALFTVVRR